MKGTIVGLVPVKGSSDRVKQKNLRSFVYFSTRIKTKPIKKCKRF